jgi:metal-responsive CopG/Arc/MetJ family transcriptional regulator
MTTHKIAITIDEKVIRRLDKLVAEQYFPNRSRAIQEAIEDKLERIEHSRLAREAAKLDRRFERMLADEGLAGGAGEWPEY